MIVPVRRIAAICLTLLLASVWLPSCSEGDTAGTVTVFGPWTGSEQDSFLAMVRPFEVRTGIRVRYEGARDLDAVVTSRLQNGTPPDLVALSTRGELLDLSARGALLSLDSVLEPQMAKQYGSEWLRLGQDKGKQKAIFVKVALKGLVWYSPTSFQAAGYQPPADWTSLADLTHRIQAAGDRPWCLGLESSSTSGWPGTDWVEDILLHQAGPEFYRRWSQGQLEWTSQKVKQAWETWGKIINDSVAGGPLGVLLTNFGNVGNGMFTDPPRCTLDHEASFITDFYKRYKRDGHPLVAGKDFDFFQLQPDNPGTSTQEVAGDLLGMFRDTPAARRLVRYIATPEAQQIWVHRGGAISPNHEVPLDAYPDTVSRKMAQIAVDATDVEFDASDLMPAAMQTAFYQAVLAYIADPGRLESLLENLEDVRTLTY